MSPVKLVLSVVLGVFGFFTLMGSFTTINSGDRGVYLILGKAQPVVLEDGFHFKLPWVSSVKKISVRVRKSESGTEAASKDLQRVNAVLAINWHISASKVNEVYTTVGDENDIYDRIIMPAVSEVLKASTAKLTAEEILTKRLELKQTIDDMLIKRLASYNVLVNDISLVHIDFTKEFNVAVEEKQIAEQSSQKAKYIAIQAETEAKAAVFKAHGEAEANNLKQKTLTPQLIQYEAIQKWDGKLPGFMGNGTVPFLNLNTAVGK